MNGTFTVEQEFAASSVLVALVALIGLGAIAVLTTRGIVRAWMRQRFTHEAPLYGEDHED